MSNITLTTISTNVHNIWLTHSRQVVTKLNTKKDTIFHALDYEQYSLLFYANHQSHVILWHWKNVNCAKMQITTLLKM